MPAGNQPSTLIEVPTPHQVAERILTLRGAQVLLDRDLAVFFEFKPIRLREQVKRNANRFPPDFIFQLTRSEVHELVSQNAIPSSRHLGGCPCAPRHRTSHRTSRSVLPNTPGRAGNHGASWLESLEDISNQLPETLTGSRSY